MIGEYCVFDKQMKNILVRIHNWYIKYKVYVHSTNYGWIELYVTFAIYAQNISSEELANVVVRFFDNCMFMPSGNFAYS